MNYEQNLYTNRELSWLDFNDRILAEANNEDVPLAERLQFLSIFQKNLDEFFMVRVGALTTRAQRQKENREDKTNMTSKEQLDAILYRVKKLDKRKREIYANLQKELAKKEIILTDFNELTIKEEDELRPLFTQKVLPYLSPIVVGKQEPFPFLENKDIYIYTLLSRKGKEKIGVIPCSNQSLPRLIEVPSRKNTFVLLEDLIYHFLKEVYPNYKILEKSIIRITRNADITNLDLRDEELDYRKSMSKLLKQRAKLGPIRLELTENLSEKSIKNLKECLDVKEDNIIKSSTPLDFNFVSSLREKIKNIPDVFYPKATPVIPSSLNISKNILNMVQQEDILLHYPYHSMKPFLKFLKDAATDSSVSSIKMTLYRVSDNSEIVNTLIEAAENGKDVTVLIELRARFDEDNNIEISKRLEEAGCKIIYGLDTLKVHSKLCLIEKSTISGPKFISQISTGNFNENTARLYTDFSLMTANQNIGKELSQVFHALENRETIKESKHLLVSPNCLQNKIIEKIDAEIQYAKANKPAYIGFKINSLTDKKIIDKLIEASQAGVQIELIVRGICCLTPGIRNQTNNIKIVSIVDRFLEHSRVYRFGTKEREQTFISSADLMTRNTERRVEVAVPIYDKNIQKTIQESFYYSMNDNKKGWEKTKDDTYLHRNKGSISSQERFIQMEKEKTKESIGSIYFGKRIFSKNPFKKIEEEQYEQDYK